MSRGHFAATQTGKLNRIVPLLAVRFLDVTEPIHIDNANSRQLMFTVQH